MKKAKVATIEEVKLIAETLDAESHKRGNEIFTDVADIWRIGFYTARGELSGECLSMHSTRKASATIVYRSTKDVLKAMKFLNHSKPETTLKYLELNDAVDDALSITGGFSL
ncbi:hypothetical protein JR736_004578 [Escherichia coli]|nr:hypothetical protein [Escherichia coli]